MVSENGPLPPPPYPRGPPTISASLWMAGHSVLTVFWYHGSARPRNVASSLSSECLHDGGSWGQGERADPSGPVSGTFFRARGSPRQTGQTLNLLGPQFLCHVKTIRFYASSEAGIPLTEGRLPGTLKNDHEPWKWRDKDCFEFTAPGKASRVGQQKCRAARVSLSPTPQ